MSGKSMPSSNGYFNKAMLNILDSDTQKTTSKSTSNNTGKSTSNNTAKNTGKKK